ncbi:MAG: cupin-like domain-containing protein [Acidobacteriota bacterium]
MDMNAGVDRTHRYAFNTAFTTDWFLGRKLGLSRTGGRASWHAKMLETMRDRPIGRTLPVERRRNLSPEQFRREYFMTGKPVVLEGIAAEWPAVKKWTFEYLLERCGQEDIDVLDGHTWKVQSTPGADAVDAAERGMKMKDLLSAARSGSGWYGSFMELLDRHADMREDIDWTLVRDYGSTSMRLPWQRNILAKMYVGGPLTSTSFHCAPVMNLYLQAYGRKRWVLIAPRFTPFMYPALSKGLNWQSRVDFRDPNYEEAPLYRYVDQYETVLEPGDVLWNPPWVWHGVQNLTESIAVSMWWANVSRTFANNPVLTPLAFLGRPNPVLLQLGLEKEPTEKRSAFSVHLNR